MNYNNKVYFKINKPNHGDSIRSMTNKELARWLTIIELKIAQRKITLSEEELIHDWFEWLEQEII